MGVMSYLSSPLWMLLLLGGHDRGWRARRCWARSISIRSASLFPVWQVSTTARTLSLYLVTLGMLLAPKLLAVLAHAASGKLRRLRRERRG